MAEQEKVQFCNNNASFNLFHFVVYIYAYIYTYEYESYDLLWI